jgi:hypothetical protein
VIFGLLLRLVMGIIAFFYPHMASGFTFTGTAMLVILGVAGTLANSILYTLFYQNSSKSWFRTGSSYGLMSLIIYGIPLFLSNPNNELFGPQAPLGISLFSALFFIGAYMLAFSVGVMTKWIDQSNRRLKWAYIGFVIFFIPATFMLGNILAEVFYEMLPKIFDNLTLFFRHWHNNKG